MLGEKRSEPWGRLANQYTRLCPSLVDICAERRDDFRANARRAEGVNREMRMSNCEFGRRFTQMNTDQSEPPAVAGGMKGDSEVSEARAKREGGGPRRATW